MMRRVVVMIAVGLATSSVCEGESPPFETPASNDVYLFEPYGSHMSFNGCVASAVGNHQYATTVYRDWEDTCDPICTVQALGDALEQGSAVLFIAAHGSDGFIIIEAYELSAEGLQARDAAFEIYSAAGWLEGHIVKVNNAFSHAIGLSGFGAMGRFNDKNTIVYLAACKSCSVMFGFDEAREGLCYEEAIPIIQMIADADLFWYYMNGGEHRLHRTVKVAATPLWDTLRHFLHPPGNETTVLSPSVLDIQLEGSPLEDGDHVRTLSGGVVAFDTRMDVTNPRILETVGPIMTGDLSWENDTCFTFQMAPYDTAFCSFCVTSAAKSASGRPLDGNMNPPNTVACGPNGDPYCLGLYALPDDPATRWGGFWAFESPEGVRVEWTTETERGSEHFRIFGLRGEERRLLGEAKAGGGPNRSTFYSALVPGGCSTFVLCELDRDGVSTASRPFSLAAEPRSLRKNARELDRLNENRSAHPPSLSDCRPSWSPAVIGQGWKAEGWPDYVFYGPDSLLEEVTPLTAYWSGHGIEALLESSNDADPLLLFEYLGNLAAASDSLGLRIPTVIVVGDANEGGEPEKNIVGTLYFPDLNGACYFSDWCTAEHDLADVDFDGLAEIHLARIPADRRSEVARSVETYLNYLQGTHSSGALFLSGDLDEGNVLATSLHEALEDVRNQYEQHGTTTVLIKDSDYPWYDYQTRQTDVAQEMNTGLLEIFAMGAISNRSRTPGMFVQKVTSPVWDMAWLTNGPSPFVFWGPGCGMADIDRDNPVYDPTLAEMFLFADPDQSAAVAWVSHGRGHWSTCHILFALELALWRWSGQTADALECFTRAKNSCVTKYPETRDYVRSLFYLGWPVRLPGMRIGECSDQRGLPAPGALLSCYPNPCNPTATVQYSLAENRQVKLAVYDVTGRRVVGLVDDECRAGVHRAIWDGRDAQGRRVCSGVYFVRLETRDRTSVVKIVMAR